MRFSTAGAGNCWGLASCRLSPMPRRSDHMPRRSSSGGPYCYILWIKVVASEAKPVGDALLAVGSHPLSSRVAFGTPGPPEKFAASTDDPTFASTILAEFVHFLVDNLYWVLSALGARVSRVCRTLTTRRETPFR